MDIYEKLENDHKQNKKSKNIRRIVLVFIFAMLSIAAAVFTFSRYQTTIESNQVLVPEDFYFESNYLTEVAEEGELVFGSYVTTEVKTYNVYTGSVDIEVRNHDLIMASEDDITYTLTFETDDENEQAYIVWDGAGEGAESIDSGTSFTLASTIVTNGNETAQEIEFSSDTFTLTADYGATVTVTATSSDPYEKTIKAIFQFQDPGNSTVYEIVDMGYYCCLNIYTGEDLEEEDAPKVITVQYITKYFSPDNQNIFMEDMKINALYEYVVDTATGKLVLATDGDGNLKLTGDAYTLMEFELDIYEGDTGKVEDGTAMPLETELVPNGFYSLVFFENTLGTYTLGQTLLDEENDYTIAMPGTPTEDEDDADA